MYKSICPDLEKESGCYISFLILYSIDKVSTALFAKCPKCSVFVLKESICPNLRKKIIIF